MDRPEDRLALIECHERDGRIGRVLDVWRWPVRLGRAMDNHVVLDDPHVAAHHAMLLPHVQGGVLLQVLDTRNGVIANGRHHPAGATVTLPPGGAQLQIGALKLRLRLPGEQLAPERPLAAPQGSARALALVMALLLLALVLLEHGISLDPGADATAWLPTLVGLPAALMLWCGLWALMSKLFQHRFDFAGHLRLALPWLLAIQALDMLLPPLASALGWTLLWQLVTPLVVVLLAALVYRHLAQVLPLHTRAVAAAVGAALLVGGGISLAMTHRSTDRLTRAPYMSTLPLPAFNFTRAVPPEQAVAEMATLAEPLARRVQQARSEEAEQGLDALGDD